MDLNHLLQSLGLEHQEANVYLAALRLGTSPASNLAKRCKIPRSTARYTCEQLVQKQLMVESQRKNTKLYTPENPEKLNKLLEMEREEIESRSLQLEGALPDLKRIYNPYTVMPKMRFYEGVEGIIELFEDVLKEAPTIFGALTFTDAIHPDIQRYISEKYVPKRKSLGNEAWMIFNDNEVTKAYQKEDTEMKRRSLLVPHKDYPFNSCIHIYSNKVAFYSYNVDDMTGVIIENQIIHDAQKSLFRLAWERARMLELNKQYIDLKLPN